VLFPLALFSARLQELATVLCVVDLWQLPNRRPIAAAAAAAAMHAAGLTPKQKKTSRKQQQQQETDSTQQQQQQQQRGPVARTAADAVLLLYRFCSLAYKPPAALINHLLAFVGPRLHELSPLQVCVGFFIFLGEGGLLAVAAAGVCSFVFGWWVAVI
jgi:hypothetical protein